MADDTGTDDDVTTDPVHGKDKKSKQQRMIIIVGVVGLILTYILIKRSSSSSSSTTASSTDQALAQQEQQDETNIAGLASQLSDIQSQVAGISSIYGSGDGNTGTLTTPATTTLTPLSGETLQGSGYWLGGPTPIVTSLGTYSPIANSAALSAYVSGGGTPYVQPAQGDFVTANESSLAPGTPQFAFTPAA